MVLRENVEKVNDTSYFSFCTKGLVKGIWSLVQKSHGYMESSNIAYLQQVNCLEWKVYDTSLDYESQRE